MDPVDVLRRRVEPLRRRLPRVRRPTYTGSNRCWPCTVLNAALLVALAAALSLFSYLLAALALAGGDAGRETDPEAVVETLVEGGVLRAEGGELYLEESFRAAWADRQAALRAVPDGEVAARTAAAAPGWLDAKATGLVAWLTMTVAGTLVRGGWVRPLETPAAGWVRLSPSLLVLRVG